MHKYKAVFADGPQEKQTMRRWRASEEDYSMDFEDFLLMEADREVDYARAMGGSHEIDRVDGIEDSILQVLPKAV